MKEKARIIESLLYTANFLIQDIIKTADEFGYNDEGNVMRSLNNTLDSTDKAIRTIQQTIKR